MKTLCSKPVLSGYGHVLESLEAATEELAAETVMKANGPLKRFLGRKYAARSTDDHAGTTTP